ncbi:MAG: hypothetical protein JNK53_05310 [Phycisphaerae bacterium]|nr:hypothetical protein [Phycisphaerae bacterium]
MGVPVAAPEESALADLAGVAPACRFAEDRPTAAARALFALLQAREHHAEVQRQASSALPRAEAIVDRVLELSGAQRTAA